MITTQARGDIMSTLAVLGRQERAISARRRESARRHAPRLKFNGRRDQAGQQAFKRQAEVEPTVPRR